MLPGGIEGKGERKGEERRRQEKKRRGEEKMGNVKDEREKGKVKVLCDAESVFCKMSLKSFLLNLLIQSSPLWICKLSDDSPKGKKLWARGHEDAAQTQLMLGPSPFSGAFQLLILNHIIPHNTWVTHSLISLVSSLSLTAKRTLLMFLMCCDALFIRLAVDMEKGREGIKKMGNGKKRELKMSKKREYSLVKKSFHKTSQDSVQSCAKLSTPSHTLLINWPTKCEHL